MITDASSVTATPLDAWAVPSVKGNSNADLRLPRGSVVRELFERPWKFDFFQAVLLLQKLASESEGCPAARIGRFERPSQESLRFAVPNSVAFPKATIPSIQWNVHERRAEVDINFMGLTGPSGMLPQAYSERLQQIESGARHSERYALRDWLDSFNHRLISLFFEAWTKYRFPIAIGQSHSAKKSHKVDPTIIRVALASIAGLDRQVLETDDVNTGCDASADAKVENDFHRSIGRDELLGLAGFLSQRPMNVANLTSALEQCLGVTVHIVSFEGCWLELEHDTQLRLGEDNHELGCNTVLGDRIWNRQQRVLIEIGPLSRDDFERFLPPSESHIADGYCRLRDLVRICVGPTLQFDIRPILQIEEPLEVELTARSSKQRLGIDSWLGSPLGTDVAVDAVFATA